MRYDVAVIGGSLGGVQAALRAAEAGKSVYLCEETDWIGGQLTSQAVPPDEHKWIEHFGATKSYMDYRNKVRNYYRSLPNIRKELKETDYFCPGNSWVSRVAHEPKVALQLLMESLNPYVENGQITIDYFTIATKSVVSNDSIEEIVVTNIKDNTTKNIQASYFLDATDCGDLLPIVGAEYRIGAESKQETGERHAPEIANPYDMQPITWVVALELNPDGEYKINKPKMYDYFLKLEVEKFGHHLLSWFIPDALTQKTTEFTMFDYEGGSEKLGLWSYRRIIDPKNYDDPTIKEVSLINWPANDFILGNIIEDMNVEENKELAKEQTMCLVYWLQNDAPRKDGGKGYAVKLRPDIMGTDDGLAKAPYIRESRRIVAKQQICEQMVSKRDNENPPVAHDSVGVGHYAIDIHLTTKSQSTLYDATWPFEIPLSAMIPIRLKNLIPACKNIGSTHLTNGCYRLHPVEWNIGEVAGMLAGFCINKNITPEEVLQDNLKEFQELIVKEGVSIHWDFSQMDV